MTIIELRKWIDLDDQVIKGHTKEEGKIRTEAWGECKCLNEELNKAYEECTKKKEDIKSLRKDLKRSYTDEIHLKGRAKNAKKINKEPRKELELLRADKNKVQADNEELRKNYNKQYEHKVQVENMHPVMYINFWKLEYPSWPSNYTEVML